MATTILVCPACKETSRTARQLPPQAKVRCGKCGVTSVVFVHGNGAIELRVPPRPTTLPPIPGTLPPRIDCGDRKVIKAKRIERPIGGYRPFEKSRDYIGTFALVALLTVGSLTGLWYYRQITTIQKATGRSAGGGDIWRYADEAKRKERRERQERALHRLKNLNAQADVHFNK